MRKKDYHLLTVGLTTYSSDERFSALHLDESEVILILSVLALGKENFSPSFRPINDFDFMKLDFFFFLLLLTVQLLCSNP